jgi:4-amino-4-deoxy-L-arabinose transferase-like glycosyltransferase
MVAAALLLALAAGAALLSPLLTYPFGRDQGVFAAAADVLSGGGVPYRDVWDVKPPGIFYLYWASFTLFGRSMLAPRLLDLIWMLATAGAVWHLGRRLLSAWAGGAGAFFFLLWYVAGHSFWNTTQPDGFACLPLVLAASAVAATEDRPRSWTAFACGTLVALAILLKFTLAAFLALPILAAILPQGHHVSRRAVRAAACLLGCGIVLAAVALAMWRAGALHDIIEVLFVWNAEYSRLRVPVPMAADPVGQTLRFLAGGSHPLLFPVGLLAVVGTIDLMARPASGRMRWFVPTWALLMMASVWVQGKYYTYHWLPVLPPLCLLAGHGMRAAGALLRRSASRPAAIALCAVAVLSVLTPLALAYWRSVGWPLRHLAGKVEREAFLDRYDRYGDFSLGADREVAAFMQGSTLPSDHVFVWGFEPLIYFLADRPPASRFIYTVPLVTQWSPTEWRAELLRDLADRRPAIIVVTHGDRLPWMTGRLDDSAAQLAEYPELKTLLETSYVPDRRIEDFDIWVLRRGGPLG